VIARVLPELRRRGFGEQIYLRGSTCVALPAWLYLHGLAKAQDVGAQEIDRYVLPGDTVPFVDLRLT
jgi:hypothetical protein